MTVLVDEYPTTETQPHDYAANRYAYASHSGSSVRHTEGENDWQRYLPDSAGHLNAWVRAIDLGASASLSMGSEFPASNTLFGGNPRATAILSILELTRLPNGWDGRNGKPVQDLVAQEAIEFLSQLPKSYVHSVHCVPFTDGKMQLEWDLDERSLEIEFAAPSLRHYLKWDPRLGVKEEGSDERVGYSGLNELVDWFYNG